MGYLFMGIGFFIIFYAMWIIPKIPWIAIIFILIGAFLIFYGLFRWEHIKYGIINIENSIICYR